MMPCVPWRRALEAARGDRNNAVSNGERSGGDDDPAALLEGAEQAGGGLGRCPLGDEAFGEQARHLLEGRVGDGEMSMNRRDLRIGLRMRAAEGRGDEGALVLNKPAHVDAPEPRRKYWRGLSPVVEHHDDSRNEMEGSREEYGTVRRRDVLHLHYTHNSTFLQVWR